MQCGALDMVGKHSNTELMYLAYGFLGLKKKNSGTRLSNKSYL